jgi:multiple sugar transport system substrate-binding protein
MRIPRASTLFRGDPMTEFRSADPLRRVLRTGAVALATLAVTATAACSSSSGENPSAGKNEDSGGVTELTYWSWTKGSPEAVDAFNAAHDDIKVKFEEIPSGVDGGYAKISDAIKAGNGPDVFNLEYYALPSFVVGGSVADITDQVSEDDLAGYDEEAVELTQLDDRQWAVPYDVGVQTMYYRKDLFKKYGLDVPTTWDEFAAAAEQVHQEHKDTYLSNLTVDDAATFNAMVQQAGGQWFSAEGDTWHLGFDDEGTQQTVDFWQGLADDKLLSTAPSYSTGFNASVSKGKILTVLLASWQAAYQVTTFPDLAGKWGVAPMPSFDGEPASGVLGGSSYAVNKDTESVEAAAEFSTWMTSAPEAIEARMGDGTSSAYVVDQDAREVAKASFKSDYYPGQDLYSVFEESASGLQPATFGPTQVSLNETLLDHLKTFGHGGSLAEAVSSAEQDARTEMSNLGLNVED